MIQSLIPKSSFVGLEGIAHLAVGGEVVMLKSHIDAVHQFMVDKSKGEPARDLETGVMEDTKRQCSQLFKVPAENIALLSSVTEGVNVVAYGLDWKPGDNVVVPDLEFPSGILPWTKLKDRGVEVRVVRNKDWVIDEQEVLDQVDENTRVVIISQVSMFTGQQMDIKKLSMGVRDAGALFLVDATHAAGVIPVDASYADIMVSSCYKWLLGVHGTAVFYWNRDRLPDFEPPFLGWASTASSGGWKNPLDFKLHDSANKFLSANPSFISIYILNNALKYLLELGETAIHQHALALSKTVREGLDKLGLELMTPAQDARRSGNVSFMVPDVGALRTSLAERGVLVWGAYGDFGRIRVSTHVHNDSDDVEKFLTAMKEIV